MYEPAKKASIGQQMVECQQSIAHLKEVCIQA